MGTERTKDMLLAAARQLARRLVQRAREEGVPLPASGARQEERENTAKAAAPPKE